MFASDYDNDFDATSEPKNIAWRDFDNKRGVPARWSKLHKTSDFGKTTECGLVVPEAYDSDCHGNGDLCRRCFPKMKSTK